MGEGGGRAALLGFQKVKVNPRVCEEMMRSLINLSFTL
jgi:hypothetical protein